MAAYFDYAFIRTYSFNLSFSSYASFFDLKRWYITELSSLDDISFSTTSRKLSSERGYKSSISLSNCRVFTGETDLNGLVYSAADDFKALFTPWLKSGAYW